MSALVRGDIVIWNSERWRVTRCWNTNIESEGFRVDLVSDEDGLMAVRASVNVSELESFNESDRG